MIKYTNHLQRKNVSFDESCFEETFNYEHVLSKTERKSLSYSTEELKLFHSQTKKMGRLLKKNARCKGFSCSNQKKQSLEDQKDTKRENITLTANDKTFSKGECLEMYCNTTLGMEKFLKSRSFFHPRKYVRGLLHLQEEQRKGIYNDPQKITSFLKACSRDSRKYALKIAAE